MRPLPALLFAALTLAGCDTKPEPASAKRETKATASAAPVPRMPATSRVVGIGDLHGDVIATRAALRLVGAIDEKDRWAGGDMTVVQTGDQLDRGDDERRIVDLFERLAGEAKAAGGAVISLVGNHETMNVSLDFRYVTPGGFKDFAGLAGALTGDARLASLPESARARGAALLPGGPYAKVLARRPVVVVVGDTVFVHGGLVPKHLRYGVERMNREASAWMDGQSQKPPPFVTAEDGPLWNRRYSAAPDTEDCKVLAETLAMIPAKRMVMGHTPQRSGISPACDGRAWRIDSGISKYYGSRIEVLEIRGDTVEVRKLAPQPAEAEREPR